VPRAAEESYGQSWPDGAARHFLRDREGIAADTIARSVDGKFRSALCPPA